MNLFSDLLDDSVEKKDMASQVPGIVTAVVKQNYDDKHPGMIKVEYIMGEAGKKMSEWIRVMAPYAGKAFGQYWLPEIGSEVVVAFVLGDRNCPIALGGLWSKTDEIPPKTADKDNTKKLFLTKGGSKLLFDDTKSKEKIMISTPKGMTIELDAEKNQILIADEKKKVTVTLNGKGEKLTLNAAKEIHLQVGGKDAVTITDQAVKISANTITLEASQKLKTSGQSTNISGGTVEVKSNGPLKVQAGAIAEIKGSLVKIN